MSTDYPSLIAEVVDSVRSLSDGRRDALAPSVGVAVAGWLSLDREVLVGAPNLGWNDRRLRHDLEAATGLPVTVHNDGNAAAWGEYVCHGRPPRGAFVMLTLGTDVGGGVVVNGDLLTGANGIAGELGHLEVQPDGPPCVCGARGCLAVFASGTAMVAGARDAVRSKSADAPFLRAACHGDPQWLTGHDLAAAVGADDPAALRVLRSAAWAIGRASAQISRVVDHHSLVLGGGASGIGEKLRLAVQAAIGNTTALGSGPVAVHPAPAVYLAGAGNQAGVRGAADLSSRAAAS